MLPCNAAAPAMTSMSRGTSTQREALDQAKRPSNSPPRGMGLCAVLRRGPANMSISAGISVNTLTMLIRMPLDSTMPMSKPMVKLMNIRLPSPATVVREEEDMGMSERLRASFMALMSSAPASRMSQNARSSIME